MSTGTSTTSLDDVKRRILGRVDLAALIGETVQLTTRSGRPVGCCPFHNEKTPSFNVFDDGHYYCFGCKASGDAITFVREQQGMSFVEALRFLAGKFGVDAPELNEARGRYAKRQGEVSLYAMMADAQQFYKTCLHDPGSDAGKAALTYLRERGFSDDNIIAFGFGMTPAEGYGLTKYLRGKGYKEQDMVASSLATTSSKDGRVYDFLRQRLTLPINDTQGRIIAFGGRTLDNNPAKYLNSRDSQLFDKSQTLFGFDKARKSIRDKGRAIVVEGYMDALQLWQQGFTETVACLGTAFTEWHLKALKHATAQVILLLDGDGAGQRATLASVATALAVPEIQVKAVALPSPEDPDSFVRKQGVPALDALIAKSVDLFDFAVGEKLRTTAQLAIPELVSSELVPWLAKIPDRIQVGYLVSKIAHRTGISADVIAGQLLSATTTVPTPDKKPRTRVGATGQLGPLAAIDRILYSLIGNLFYAAPGELDTAQIRMAIARDFEVDTDYGGLLEDLLATLEGGHCPAMADRTLWPSALDVRISNFIDKLATESGAFAIDNRPGQVALLLRHSHEAKNKRVRQALLAELYRRQASNDQSDENTGKIRELMSQISELQRGERTAKA